MRLVSHPNVVDLKAFFYSNGDKVRFRITGRVVPRSTYSEAVIKY
jgi:hypothetical protein